MTKSMMSRRRARAVLGSLRRMSAGERARVLARLPGEAVRAIAEEWWWQAHGGQIEPGPLAGSGEMPWRVWLIMAGRGFGKTRAGAEWVWARARADGEARIALVGGSFEEVAKVMVEGESGLLACARPGETPRWKPSLRTLTFPSGAQAFAYSAERPAALRGPQHHFAWADELAKWRRPEDCWPNLRLGLRLGTRPRAIVTTTPQPGALLQALVGDAEVAVTRGRTDENSHLAADFRSAMAAAYGGTRIGRQELEGLLLGEAEGSLWPRALIEQSRRNSSLPREFFSRIVIGVDPPASAAGTCGIVACGLDEGGIFHVLGDHSAMGASPRGWAEKVAAAARLWGADRIVAEANNGGNMVAETLASADSVLPVKLVSASRGKVARAEPVAALFEAGKAVFAGAFPELEDELAGLCAGGAYCGPGKSPDRADAMVWAMTELKAPVRAAPQIRLL